MSERDHLRTLRFLDAAAEFFAGAQVTDRPGDAWTMALTAAADEDSALALRTCTELAWRAHLGESPSSRRLLDALRALEAPLAHDGGRLAMMADEVPMFASHLADAKRKVVKDEMVRLFVRTLVLHVSKKAAHVDLEVARTCLLNFDPKPRLKKGKMNAAGVLATVLIAAGLYPGQDRVQVRKSIEEAIARSRGER